jgi:DNA primase
MYKPTTPHQGIRSEIIEAIRSLCPIEQIIGEHIHLRRAGVELAGLCPFHADKTPSFYVRPSKAVFHCHGCQVGGDVFEFVRLLHDCSFRQSVKVLASRVGIRINGFEPSLEFTSKVTGIKAKHEDELAFKRFCDNRLRAVNERCRSLGRAATRAEDYLRARLPDDPYINDLAWNALERYRDFESRIEHEGLCDLINLRAEWEQMREVV